MCLVMSQYIISTQKLIEFLIICFICAVIQFNFCIHYRVVTTTSQAAIQLPSTISPSQLPSIIMATKLISVSMRYYLVCLFICFVYLVLLLDFIYSKIYGVFLSPVNLFRLACVCVGHSVISDSMGLHGL